MANLLKENRSKRPLASRLGIIAGSILLLMLVLIISGVRDSQPLLALQKAAASNRIASPLFWQAAVQPHVGPVDSLWPPGEIHAVLYDQHLSLHAFHGLKGPLLDGILQRLAGKKEAKRTVVICGLEYGEEAELYATAGLRTIVFEPLTAWADKFMERVSDEVAGGIVMHKVGAAVQRRYGVLEYQGKSEDVMFDPLDSYVSEHVTLLALDTQGTEYEILLGGKNLLTSHGVDILEIEVVMEERDPLGGPPHIKEMLTMLDQLGYVLFDFSWWGARYNATSRSECLPSAEKDAPPHCYHFGRRPTLISEYVDHMHGVQRSRFNWMQTDLLAIRRDVFTQELARFLESLSDLCTKDVCALKRALGEL